MTLLVCFGVYVVGAMHPFFFGPEADPDPLAQAVGFFLPNLTYFDPQNMVSADQAMSAGLVGLACVYWLALTVGALAVGAALFETRQLESQTASVGMPSLVAMLSDVEAIVRAMGVADNRLIAFGRSVGSIYALELAARHPTVAGVVLDSALADPLERILLRVQPEEIGATAAELAASVHEHLDQEKKLRSYPGPLLVLHARGDTLIPSSHAERLASWGAAGRTELALLADGDHNSMMKANWVEYWRAFDRFLTRVRATPG